MSDQKRKKLHDDMTTDFFLNYIKKEKDDEKQNQKIQKDVVVAKDRTVGIFATAYNAINRFLDRLLISKMSLRFLSLILTLILFFQFAGNNLSTTSSGRIIRNVPVNVEGLGESYAVSGVPDTVSVGLIGPALSINATRIASNYEVYVDVSDLKEGTHTVSLKTRNFNSSLSVWILPETVDVSIDKRVSRNMAVTPHLTGLNKLDDQYNATIEQINPDTVTVSCGSQILNQIDHIRADVDVSSQTADFSENVTLVAYDEDGNVLECEIKPAQVEVQCSIASYSKTVAIKPTFKGKVAKGYTLRHYKLSDSTVTIYGKRSKISDISSIDCEVDITNLNSSTTLTGIKLNSDDAITKMSLETIDVTLTIEKN